MMKNRTLSIRTILTATLVALMGVTLSGCAGIGRARRADLPPVLAEFNKRVEVSRGQLPTITKAAEAAAERVATHADALIRMPYRQQRSFAEEMSGRAGGLADIHFPRSRRRPASAHDVLLLPVRSWEANRDEVLPLAAQAKERGWLVVLFASKAGMPEGLEVDYLIDNGAATGAGREAPGNAIANILNAWLWNSEYAAALTRRGRYPGVLLSIGVSGGEEHNRQVGRRRDGSRFLGETSEAVPGGKLAGQYLKRVTKMLRSVGSERTQKHIQAAADLIAAELAAGKTVGVSSCVHSVPGELFEDCKTKMKPFNWRGENENQFKANLEEGDLLVWFGYVGMDSKYYDFATPIREAGLRLICSYAPASDDLEWTTEASGALAHIEQSWELPDAEVKVPFPPGCMAPVSGIESVLLYRMLEDAVATDLEAQPPER